MPLDQSQTSKERTNPLVKPWVVKETNWTSITPFHPIYLSISLKPLFFPLLKVGSPSLSDHKPSQCPICAYPFLAFQNQVNCLIGYEGGIKISLFNNLGWRHHIAHNFLQPICVKNALKLMGLKSFRSPTPPSYGIVKRKGIIELHS